MKRFAIHLLLCMLSFTGLATAQETAKAEPSFMSVNFNKVKMTDMSALRKIWFDQAVPVLKELKSEGKLLDYGLMQHAWGDEWNYNFYFVTRSHASYLEFWDAYISRMQEKYPDSMTGYLSMIIEHKDNMYTLYK